MRGGKGKGLSLKMAVKPKIFNVVCDENNLPEQLKSIRRSGLLRRTSGSRSLLRSSFANNPELVAAS
jgi:hypothetical protein